MINVEPEVIEYLKRQAADPYFEPEPSAPRGENGLAMENSMCREYPDPEA